MITDHAFLKRFGFHRPPRAYFEGSFVAHKNGVTASLTCKMCNRQVNINFRGNPDTMTEAGIKDWVLKRAEHHHQCPAVTDALHAKMHRHYSDIRRGNEKLKEQEYKRKFLGHS
jgi:hypothetical protein